MGAKQIIFDQEAREAIRVGIRTLARAVKVTLGPRGRKVILEKSFGSPTITKDGVTVAKEVELEDKYADLGAKMVKEVAQKTNDAAGDGTTTATILAEALFDEGLRHAVAGVNPVSIKRGIDKAVEAIVAELNKMAIKVKDSSDISNVASVAANHDRSIGDYIAQAMDKVGKDGVITIEEGKSSDTSVELVEGMQFDRGYQSPYFVTNPGDMEAVLEDAFVLIHEKKLSSIQDMVPLLEKIAQSGKPLLIISEEVEGEALATLVLNKMRGTLKVCAVKAPGYGDRRKEMLGDIAVLTGGKSIMEDLGIKLESIQIGDLGRVKKAVVDKENCTLVEGAGKTADIKSRITQIRNQIDATTSDYDKEKLEERLAKLAGGVAQINVGAATESEMKEKKYRVEDALNAARAAVEEGILPGGGTALIRAAVVLDKLKASEDEKIGIDIVRKAVDAPLRTLADNAGVEGAVAVSKVKEFIKENKKDWGFNALTNEYSDLMKDGVFDTTKVVRLALTNAASIAGLLLTTDAVITDAPKKDAPAHAAPSPEDMY